MTLYLIIAIVALLGVIVFLVMSKRSAKVTIEELRADNAELLKNVAAIKQNMVDNATIAAWKKAQEEKIEAGNPSQVLSDIIAGNNAGVHDVKTRRDNTAS